jgi:beta-barrel assembly-enhancing protease
MNRIFIIAAAWVLPLITCTARATITPAPKPNDQVADASVDAAGMVQQAFTDITHNDAVSGQAKLDKAIQSSGFADLPADLRYRALLVASMIAAQDGQNEKAHERIMQATALDDADDVAWMTRLSTAFSIGDYSDAAHGVAVIAQRWPGKLGDLNPGAVGQVHQQLKQSPGSDVDREMLDSLFDARWQNKGVEPSDLWRDLALLHIERNENARAAAVAVRITSGQAALSMQVDKRFDPITLKHPRGFDVDRLVAAQIEAAQQRMKAHPDQLGPVTDLQELLLVTSQYSRVLSISDAVVAHAEHGDGAKTYTDFDDRYNWVLDNRVRAFKRQGHWDDALRVGALATRRPEHGGMNVSQLINLGELYADLEQPDKAANAIVELGEMSPFGRMQLESVKLRIAVQRHDAAAIAACMGYLREHRADAIATWQDALLLRGELDEAAALLIERLEKPVWRNAALVDMQHYAEVTETPVEKTIDARWNTITARADVQAAMRKVGRVGSFHVTSALR